MCAKLLSPWSRLATDPQSAGSAMECSGERGGGEEEGRELGLEFTEITTSMEGLDKSEMYHVVKEIIGFVLHMHQQIPAVLQCLEDEFEDLKEERESLEGLILQPTKLKASTQRMQNFRIREVKQRIRKLEKLMSSISNLLASFSSVLGETTNALELILVLGASLARPQHAYEIFISSRRDYCEVCEKNNNRKLKEALSRKVIRTLMNMGAGGVSYTGPTKLFLLIKAPCTLDLPSHFLPKRDFRYTKKVTPLRLHIKCQVPDKLASDSCHTHQTGHCCDKSDSSSADLIWFHCRHSIKGLPCKSPLPE